MITLYTAIGNYKLNAHGLPTIFAGDNEYALDTHELILWTILAFRILTYQELKKEFYAKERELHILGELDFDHYLNRLKVRRLIVSGQDYTGIDALYDLIGHLHVQAIPGNLFLRTITFLKLWLISRISFAKASLVLHTEKPEPLEKQILSLVRHQTLSTAELILCIQNGATRLHNSQELIELLYSDELTDCESILSDCRVNDFRYLVLTAIVNLYFKQRISFCLL